MSLFYLPSKPFWRSGMALTKAKLETAAEAIIATGQSVTVDGMTYTAASLPTIMKMIEYYENKERSATRPTSRQFNMRAMS
jgi:hypothetical protein